MMESDERLSMYFDDALSKISEARVLENFMNSLIKRSQTKGEWTRVTEVHLL